MSDVGRVRCFFQIILMAFSGLCHLAWLQFVFLSAAFGSTPISGFNPALLTDERTGFFMNVSTLWSNTAISQKGLFSDDWSGPFKPRGTNWADAYWKTDTGIYYKKWRMAGYYRGELFIKANRDTVEILRMTNLKQDLPVGREFSIDMEARGFSGGGVELSRGEKFGNFALGLTARYIGGEKVQQGFLRGSAHPIDGKTYDFNLKLDYIYDKNFIYDRRDSSYEAGNGYSFDFGMIYSFNENLKAEILVRDAFGRIYWKDVMYTDADAVSEDAQRDEDGYMLFKPMIRGYEGYRDFTQTIPVKTDISVVYEKHGFVVKPVVNIIRDRPLYWVNLGYKKDEKFFVGLGYNTNYESFFIESLYKNFMLRVCSDHWDFNKSMSIGLTLGMAWMW